MTFVESYIRTLTKLRFITLITSAFLLSLLFFEVLGNLNQYFYPAYQLSGEDENILNVAILFQLIILFFFLVRMILVCFTKPKQVWVSQSFWLLHWFTIFLYSYISSQIDNRGIDPNHFPSFFLTMLNGVASWFLVYMLLSPIKQISTLIFAYFYRK
jgi:hypothetical protein